MEKIEYRISQSQGMQKGIVVFSFQKKNDKLRTAEKTFNKV